MISEVGRNLLSIPGWSSKRQIVVFESDDWGTIRMPSLKVYEKLKTNGIDVESNPYNKYDCLESNSDIHALAEILFKYRDKYGNSPVLTTNFILANPDFDKIRKSLYQEYYYEHFYTTYFKYYSNNSIISTLNDVIKSGLFYPQFHGREHLNVLLWLELLRNKEDHVIKSFEHQTFGIGVNLSRKVKNLMAAYDYKDDVELKFILKGIEDGLNMFTNTFQYDSKSFIAPNHIWDQKIEKKFHEKGVRYIQSVLVQKKPIIERYQKVYRISGSINRFGQRYMVRNCYFEPSTSKTYDWINECLDKIGVAFFWRKPAIISVHRLNFIGSISEENRTNNLMLFDKLLNKILMKYPNVEFMNSVQLAELMDY